MCSAPNPIRDFDETATAEGERLKRQGEMLAHLCLMGCVLLIAVLAAAFVLHLSSINQAPSKYYLGL